MLVAWTIASAVCAAIPAVMTVVNLREYREPSAITSDGLPAVTVIIPHATKLAVSRPAWAAYWLRARLICNSWLLMMRRPTTLRRSCAAWQRRTRA